ncbi:unnamed protein product [Callosobruchus maculatus]|uniref:Peptidase C14 caspase domain-containing protein n=1 Tax=Callosobruchus maculatus TaxID=64391 RepID=A0A653D0X4_CALMS|nr:unnamed protein product [Callosobruchus maculatus]
MADRRPSHSIDERIEVKPSVELIPDEFEHHAEDGSDIVIHAFTEETDEDNKNIDGQIYIRFNNTDIPIDIQLIWKYFTYKQCKGLKNKPKIFIFEIRMILNQVDDAQLRAPTYALTYDTPAEADILVIYNKTTDETHGKFMKKLGKFMRKYSQREDIITLVSCIPSDNFRPMIISTLTRKFYFTPSECRGHYFNLYELEKELTSVLHQMKDAMGSVQEKANGKKKIKKRFSFLFRPNNSNSDREQEADERQLRVTENQGAAGPAYNESYRVTLS